MDWVLRSPQVHSTFGNLGVAYGDGYHINANCNSTLESILQNILTEDKYLRTYRRSISFGQNVKKDLIPLFINAKEDQTIELLVKILVNLTIPIECLLSVDAFSKTDFGRHTIFEINNLLVSSKSAFTDHRVTKVLIEYLKKNIAPDQHHNLTVEQCTNICNSLLLLRNILHIPEETFSATENGNPPGPTTQNQILWNMFSQSIDKILIKLMTIPEATHWSVSMVQLVALLYKDQHVVKLQKLLNVWLEASISESSEDNESNTSPQNRSKSYGRENRSPMLTSDPPSDSSDTSGSGKGTEDSTTDPKWRVTDVAATQPAPPQSAAPATTDTKHLLQSGTPRNGDTDGGTNACKKDADIFVCRFGTQYGNQESASTSSNDDDLPAKKPVNQKPHKPKQRANTKARIGLTIQDKKRKKIVKRAKANNINVQGLSHTTPTDDDISNILKEFTVDFLIKGYNSLVETLHKQILTNSQLEIDTSHFYWLLTYFLKFVTQIELDLEHVSSVLSYDIVSYLTAEGVNLCEQFELSLKFDGGDLKPSVRRVHLLVTAIREFIQAIETYKKAPHTSSDAKSALTKLHIKICDTDELQSLFVLLLRHYNQKYHSKQYLQDLIVTNHILLLFMEHGTKLEEYNNASISIAEHLKQFAAPEIMTHYGSLLEGYSVNGEFVNDCVFTMMHHVAGDLDCLIALFQPKILKAFTSIWESEHDICDDWSDLIEYVINTFIKKPHILQMATNFRLNTESFDEDVEQSSEHIANVSADDLDERKCDDCASCEQAWTQSELSSLNWNYMQCITSNDVIGDIIKMYKDEGACKSRESVLNELYKQNIIDKEEFDVAFHNCANKDERCDEISNLCEELKQDGKSKFLEWTQKVLLDICYVKKYLEKKAIQSQMCTMTGNMNILNFEIFNKKSNDIPAMSAVSYHCILLNEPIPLVPWNIEQAAVTKDLRFLQLMHRLGLYIPADTGKLFIRIPCFWNSDYLYEVAKKIIPFDKSKFKFVINEVDNGVSSDDFAQSEGLDQNMPLMGADRTFQMQEQTHMPAMINFTPISNTILSEGHIQKPNWLEVIQFAQEIKLSLKVKGSLMMRKRDLLPRIAPPPPEQMSESEHNFR